MSNNNKAPPPLPCEELSHQPSAEPGPLQQAFDRTTSIDVADRSAATGLGIGDEIDDLHSIHVSESDGQAVPRGKNQSSDD